MSPEGTLHEALDRAAAGHPDAPVTFPPTGGSISLSELAGVSRAMGAALVAAGVAPGERVGILSQNSPEFLLALVASCRAGAAACPLPLPSSTRDLAGYAIRLRGTAASAGLRHVITGARMAGMVSRFATALGDVRFLPADDLATGPAHPVALPPAGPESLALVQFTSGSTAVPKGVRLTHRNILAGIAAIIDGLELSGRDHGGSWLPLFHDMGLFATLSAMVAGIPMTVWSPAAFVKDPAGWLGEFLARGVTISPMPSFGYSYLTDAVPAGLAASLDMRRWRVALNGAEPIPPAAVERFLDRFAPAGFAPEAMFPVYGMAEATLAVTFPPLGRPPLLTWVDRDSLARDGIARDVAAGQPGARGLVGVGRPVAGMRVRVVPDGPAGDDRVGEIQIRGASVTDGYLPAGDPVTADGWLRTGDLGFLRAGELFVTGRRKEMIIVRGVNYYPEDVESVIRDAPGLYRGRCVAFADADGAETISVLAESRLADPGELARLAADLRQAVTAALGLPSVTVGLLPPGSLPRTSSGKFQRLAARELARRATPHPLPEPRTARGTAHAQL